MNGKTAPTLGRPPLSGEPMIKKTKSIILSKTVMDWLESQPNQAGTIRMALLALMSKGKYSGPVNEPTMTVSTNVEDIVLNDAN